MRKLLLSLLLISIVSLSLLRILPAEAAACAYDGALEDASITIGGTLVEVEIDPATKPATGNALYNDATVTVCIREDDAGNVAIVWQRSDGTALQSTDTNVDTNTDITLSVANIDGYVGPVRFFITPDAGGTGTTDFFFFLAPPPPTETTTCTGPSDTCFDYTVEPQYALGGQVYNPVFNTRLRDTTDWADVAALPKDGYFANTQLKNHGYTDVSVPGLYADDVTYATNSDTIGEWVLLYWWLQAGGEGFPAWTVTFQQDVRDIAGDAVDLSLLVTNQNRTFTTGTDYFGYVAIVLDRVVTDFTTGTDAGWYAQLDASAVGTETSFFGVWEPDHTGTYAGVTKSIPSDLNGGYLHIVEAPTVGEANARMLTMSLLGTPADLVSGRRLLSPKDEILSGEVQFYRGTNSRIVNYSAKLRNLPGQDIQEIELANTDGIALSRIPFSFLELAVLIRGNILIREDADPKLPAILVRFVSADIKSDLVPIGGSRGLTNYVGSASVQGSDVNTALQDFAAAYGLQQSIGNLLVALVPTLFLAIFVITKTGSMAIAGFAAVMSMTIFIFLGVLPPAWLLLPLWLAIGVTIGWKVLVREGG